MTVAQDCESATASGIHTRLCSAISANPSQNGAGTTRPCTFEYNRGDLHACSAGITASGGEVGKGHSAEVGPKWTQVGSGVSIPMKVIKIPD
jgi:hypothetical protein